MQKGNRTVIFFSLYYPFNFADSYLDEEIKKLALKFDKIIIVSFDTTSVERRPAPPNAVIYRFSPYNMSKSRIRSLGLLFKGYFYKELWDLPSKYKISLSFSLIAELFAYYLRTIYTKDLLDKIIAEQNCDRSELLIYTYWMLEPTFAAAMIKMESPEVKVASRVHSLDVYFFRNPVNYLPFRKLTFDHSDHLYFISADGERYFAEKHHLTSEEKKKLSIARIGIPGPSAFRPQAPTTKLVILSVAFLRKLKRIDLIVDALALIDDIDIDWYHAGDSAISDQDFENMKQYAKDKLAGKRNIRYFFEGKTLREQLERLYEDKNFDLFLNVSETEGIPVSMMEAMSYSVPVIGTNVGGVSEIVEDNINGLWLSPYPDANEVAKAITAYWKLLPEQKDAYRKNAYTTWDTKYNAERNDTQIVKDIVQLMN